MTRRDRHFFIGSVVRHFMGDVYRIEDFARHTETGEIMVIYRQTKPPFRLFARPEAIFCSPVDKDKHPYAKQEFRFEKVSIDEMLRTNAQNGSETKESE